MEGQGFWDVSFGPPPGMKVGTWMALVTIAKGMKRALKPSRSLEAARRLFLDAEFHQPRSFQDWWQNWAFKIESAVLGYPDPNEESFRTYGFFVAPWQLAPETTHQKRHLERVQRAAAKLRALERPSYVDAAIRSAVVTRRGLELQLEGPHQGRTEFFTFPSRPLRPARPALFDFDFASIERKLVTVDPSQVVKSPTAGPAPEFPSTPHIVVRLAFVGDSRHTLCFVSVKKGDERRRRYLGTATRNLLDEYDQTMGEDLAFSRALESLSLEERKIARGVRAAGLAQRHSGSGSFPPVSW